MKKFILSISLIITASPSFSQERLSLRQCKDLALKNNAQIQNADLSVKISEQQRKEAFTKYFPSVSGMAAAAAFDRALMTTTVETGYPAPNDKVQVDMIKNNAMIGAMAIQPLFAGGQIINGNKLAKVGQEVSRLQKQLSENDVLLATERYFWQIVSLKEKMKTIENSAVMLEHIRSDVNAAVEAGLTTRNDLLRVELEQNRLESGRLKVRNGLQILKMALAQHIGLETDTFDVEPEEAIDEIPAFIKITGNAANRPEYKLLEKSVEAARLQHRMEIGKNLPTVAIGVGYNALRMDWGLNTEMNKKFGVAFATVSVPISDWWGGSHAIKRKKLEIVQAENTKREKSDLLLLQIRQTGNELQEACQQVQLAKKSISSAEENLKISRDNFNAGITALSDLLEAQNLLQQSRDQYAEAVSGYYVKLAEYKQVTGQ